MSGSGVGFCNEVPPTERGQWELASSLLMEHGGIGIVAYLAERCAECREIGEHAQAQRWIDFTLKVEALMDQEGKAAE